MNNAGQRRPKEPARAYHAYCVYRDLGPRRSLPEAWRLYRQTPPKGKSRGRPRLAHAEAGRPSGQWTTWSSQWQWAERAADFDAQVEAQKRQAHLEGIQVLERKRLKVELSAQERFEEQVSDLEAKLDEMDKLPITGYTVWKREVDGKHVNASKTRVQSINLFGYVRLLRATDEAARFAIVGAHGVADQRSQTFNDHLTATSVRSAPGTDAASNTGSTDRLPGESARAYRAYLAYRDQGPQRSLAAAWTADRQKSDPATKDGKQDRETRRASGRTLAGLVESMELGGTRRGLRCHGRIHAAPGPTPPQRAHRAAALGFRVDESGATRNASRQNKCPLSKTSGHARHGCHHGGDGT